MSLQGGLKGRTEKPHSYAFNQPPHLTRATTGKMPGASRPGLERLAHLLTGGRGPVSQSHLASLFSPVDWGQ